MGNKLTLFTSPIFLTDGGLETTLIFHQGITLNHFAAFELLNKEKGKQSLRAYYKPYLELAAKYGTGFILETPTWRANPDWGLRLGYSPDELKTINREAVNFVKSVAREHKSVGNNILISGNIGPRGDGYTAAYYMTPRQAQAYHTGQIQVFTLADVDIITAMTINYSDEAIGIVRAAKSSAIPVVISFTVETDGKLSNGESIRDAIEKTDDNTGGYAEHFMINCAHPEHFRHILNNQGHWKRRIKGIRANASAKSHSELDEAETLDAGDKQLLADEYLQLHGLLPELKVIGGCCGMDHGHLEEICKLLLPEKINP